MALFHVNVSHWLKMTSRPNQANIYLFQIYNHTICFALDRKLGCILNGLIFFTSSNRCYITCFIRFESKIYRYGKQRYKWSISKKGVSISALAKLYEMVQMSIDTTFSCSNVIGEKMDWNDSSKTIFFISSFSLRLIWCTPF